MRFTEVIQRQVDFSGRTFGPGSRLKGNLAHIRQELEEIEEAPDDIEEWADLIILAIDGAWRQGFNAMEVADAVIKKITKNEARDWPDYRAMSEDEPINHVKT